MSSLCVDGCKDEGEASNSVHHTIRREIGRYIITSSLEVFSTSRHWMKGDASWISRHRLPTRPVCSRSNAKYILRGALSGFYSTLVVSDSDDRQRDFMKSCVLGVDSRCPDDASMFRPFVKRTKIALSWW
ncbi:hypothetical protein LIA77_05308 [Sarocladium implicatum]|nr:hypothetical protein LIA77_05308 [Sarocladium implicatum]